MLYSAENISQLIIIHQSLSIPRTSQLPLIHLLIYLSIYLSINPHITYEFMCQVCSFSFTLSLTLHFSLPAFVCCVCATEGYVCVYEHGWESCVYPWVCVDMCTHVLGDAYVCVSLKMPQEKIHLESCSVTFYLLPLRKAFHWTWCQTNVQWAQEIDTTVPASHSARITSVCGQSWDLDSGPHVCLKSVFAHWAICLVLSKCYLKHSKRKI